MTNENLSLVNKVLVLKRDGENLQLPAERYLVGKTPLDLPPAQYLMFRVSKFDEETGELWHSPAGSAPWQPVNVEHDAIAPGMREGSWSRGFTAFASAIVDALREGRKTVEAAATFEDGYRIQLVLDAARASNKSGCWAKIQ